MAVPMSLAAPLSLLPLLRKSAALSRPLATRCCGRQLHTSVRRLPSAVVYFPDGGSQHGLGKVLAYPLKPGAAVESGDVVAEVEAGPSAVLEVASTHTGTVSRLLSQPGAVVRPGDPLVELNVSFADYAAGWWRALGLAGGQGGSR
eukprot:TRINITY_DN10290_c0_g1_i1.p1 TRINITY_DN10290_c0_g1~~TRINITY_DN10290_c0_g1_i1.p1  ORF type:complete len:146 (+),score=22.14 TRINITY_DN10290_c0_g1_i1:62-499(+)